MVLSIVRFLPVVIRYRVMTGEFIVINCVEVHHVADKTDVNVATVKLGL